MEPLDEVIRTVLESKRYRRIDETTVRRSASLALKAARGNVADAVKRTKRHLHQIHGAYLDSIPRYDRLLERVAAARARGPDAVRNELRSLMRLHASTRERVPDLERIYSAIFERVGRTASVLDLGCGLNPLAAPWMDLEPAAEYTAVDIDGDLVEFVAGCLDLLGFRAHSLVRDVIASPPEIEVELAFMLKMWPCLEQQEPDAALALLRSVRARASVISFPVRSLGGRAKGMRENYSQQFESKAGAEPWKIERLDTPHELIYILTSSPASGTSEPRNSASTRSTK